MRTFINGENGLTILDHWQPNCWINIECPTLEELNYLTEELHIPQSFLNDIEDPDERPRIELEDDWKIIIIRIPVRDTASRNVPFFTVPLGIILRGDVIVTLCYHQNEMIADLISYNQRKNRGFTNRYNLVLRLLLSSSVWFLKYLKQLNIEVKRAEKKLERSVKNSELQSLLHIENCYVFFITSINGNLILLQRLKNLKNERDFFDEDLLEDAEIELRQAQESTNIYSGILSGMMDAYASVISNNVNDIMKQLTSVSIVLMIPTMIASFYGMNVPNPLQYSQWGLTGIIAISILLFAYSTTLGWSHYGTKAVEYLFGTTGSETSLQIDPGLIRCQTCVSAYISTAFLCGGTVTDPQKEYNLEFLTGRTNLAKDFEALLAEHEFAPHRTRRNGVNLIYVKSSASVERILAFMGAAEASARMNAQKAVKQLRNQINRQTNCDTANLGKTARANAQTTRAIRFLQEQGALETLPEVLQQAAAMRMENPDLSLTALCACFDPPVSKSGLSHRMKKLEALAEDLRRRLEENAEKEETK